MTTVTFKTDEHEVQVDLEPDETVLEGLERSGVPVPSSCRSGVCQTCLVRARSGTPPAEGQEDLPATWRRLGYFLACVSCPENPLEVTFINQPERWSATVISTTALASGHAVRLSRPPRLEIFGGRTVRLPDRSSTAVISTTEDSFDVYWSSAQPPRPQEVLSLEGPFGDAFWVSEFAERPIAVACDDAGWTHALGFIRDACASDPPAQSITAWIPRSVEVEWFATESIAGTLDVRPCEEPLAAETILARNPDLTGWRVFLAGDPTKLRAMRGSLFRAGASPSSLLLVRCEGDR